MKLKSKFLWILAAAAMLCTTACTDDDEPSGNGGGSHGGDTPGKDIVDEVSQYEARAFDGQKRGDVFYEIYVRSFADSDRDGIGDLKGVTAKLDYLDDMGVSGIWLMPVYKAGSEHGYDVIDYREIQPEYGTVADLEELVREAHERNIRVILDFVPNHMSDRSEWFRSACSSVDSPYRGFFHFSTTQRDRWYSVPTGTTDYFYQGDFDRSMPDLNYGQAATCDGNKTFKAMADAAKFWVEKGVDGFRLDAVKHIYDNQTSDENPTFLKKFYNELNDYYRGHSTLGGDIYMVGECWMDTYNVARYYRGLPALFDFDCWDKYLLYAIQNSHAKWFPKDMIASRRVFASERADFIQATKLSNHDQNRTRTSVGGQLKLSGERAKMAAAVLLTSCGQPFIYYGEEIGMMGDKFKAGGDRNVRTPMLWDAKAKDTYRATWVTSDLNSDMSIGNVASQSRDRNSIYNVYRKFMRLRNTYPALARGEIELPADFDDADSENKQVMVFYRTLESERLLVIHNVSEKPSTYVVNHAIKRPVADMNRVTVETKSADRHEVVLPPYSSIIIEL